MKLLRLGTFFLLAVGTCALALAEATQPLQAVRIDIFPKFSSTAPIEGPLTLRSDQEGVPPVKVPLHGLEPVRLKLPQGSRWEISAEVPGYWVRREAFTVGTNSDETVQRIVLWPKGKISGTIRWADGQDGQKPLPATLTVSTLAPRKGGMEPPKGVLDCPVEAGTGRWGCELPAATYDLSAAAAGFIPRYFWGTGVTAGKTLDLGVLTLQRGASVVAWVEAEGAIDPASCRARLSLTEAAGRPSNPGAQPQVAAIDQAVPKSGFLQIAGLAPGVYSLEIRQEGYSEARVTPIRVVANAETAIETPIVLRRPLPLELTIEPALDWLGKPWTIRVARQSEVTRAPGPPVFAGAADVEGRVVVPEQASGIYTVSVSDSLGNRLFHDLDWVIRGPEDLRRTISISLVTVRGTVRLGKIPLHATLWFGGERGALGVKMESDSDGRFHGVLPKDGTWTVEVEAVQPPFASQATVEVKANRQGKANLEIVLPDTHLFGTVLQENGRPASGAHVVALEGNREILIEAKENGSFDLRGFPPGGVELAATFSSAAEGASSVEGVSTVLVDGQPVGPIELRLRRSQAQAGRVVSAQGGVAGALVEVASREVSTPLWKSATTDLEGRFTVQVPAGTRSLQAVVSAPGRPLQAFEVPAGPAPLALTLAESGGTLEIELPKIPSNDASTSLELFQNGLLLPLSTVWRWVRGQGSVLSEMEGSPMRIPQVASGDYRACLLVRGAGAEAGASGKGSARCDAGTLSSGGTLRLRPTLPGS